jgi:hypothetical protein
MTIQPLNLTAVERQDVRTFRESLTGEVAKDIASPPVLPD